MKVLLGTDVLLYYLQKQELVDGIDLMLQWMERIKAVAYTDISSVAVLTNFVSLNAFGDLRRLEILDGIRPKASEIENLELKDSMLPTFAFEYKPLLAQLNWLFYDDIDYLVTENPMSHKLAKRLEVDDKVFTIENF